MKWSTEQSAIFEWFAKTTLATVLSLVVRARAGTGKTTTILEAVRHAPEERILLAAFGKQIADELNDRITDKRCEARTLHSLGNRFVRDHWRRVKLSNRRQWDLAEFALQGQDAPDPIVSLVAKLHTKVREVAPHADSVYEVCEVACRFDLLPAEQWEDEGWDLDRCCEAALVAVRQATRKTAEIDYSDMIFLPLRNGWVRPCYDLVIIDEAQDMTEAQLELAQKACVKGGRIAVVGDDRQAIYAFRGADSGSLDRLKAELDAAELGLATTYRCPKAVVAEAQALVPDYVAADSAPEGEVLHVDAGEYLAQVQEGDFVLSRTNAPLVRVCLALLRQGKRAKVRGKDVEKGIRDVLNKLRPESIPHLLDQADAWAEAERKRVQREVERERFDEHAAEQALDLVEDQRALIVALCDGLIDLDELDARLKSLFAKDPKRGEVMCATVHRAKGLEAPQVFVLADTFKRAGAEEDNIRYVAITRAKEKLVWVAE